MARAQLAGAGVAYERHRQRSWWASRAVAAVRLLQDGVRCGRLAVISINGCPLYQDWVKAAHHTVCLPPSLTLSCNIHLCRCCLLRLCANSHILCHHQLIVRANNGPNDNLLCWSTSWMLSTWAWTPSQLNFDFQVNAMHHRASISFFYGHFKKQLQHCCLILCPCFVDLKP